MRFSAFLAMLAVTCLWRVAPAIAQDGPAPQPPGVIASAPTGQAAKAAPDAPVPEQPPEPAPAALTAALDAEIVAMPPAPVAPVLVTLQYERLPGMCMAMSGPDGESESRPCDASAAQAFVLPAAEGGPIMTGTRCLAAKGAGQYPQLSASKCDGSPEQRWTVSAEGVIRNASNRCLSLLGASSRIGERIYAGECPANFPAQHWRAINVDAAVKPVLANIESKSQDGKCLGHDGALGLVDCGRGFGRVFSLDSARPGQIRMMGSCLASGYVFEAVTLSQCWDMPAQTWMLTSEGHIKSGEGKCIAVVNEGGRFVLRTAACQPVAEQHWALKDVEP